MDEIIDHVHCEKCGSPIKVMGAFVCARKECEECRDKARVASEGVLMRYAAEALAHLATGELASCLRKAICDFRNYHNA